MSQPPVAVVAREAGPEESARANRSWWDAQARSYQDQHGDFLGDADLLWCPEGLREADAHLLGELAGRDVLEIGCGAAQGARWLVGAGARVSAFDVSYGQLLESRRLDQRSGVPVFSITHPVRWVFPDDPGPLGLTVQQSYFDRTPYVEVDSSGAAVYVEHHRTLGDRIRELVQAGLVLEDLIEPEWPAGHDREWGQWSPLRGRLLPGTAIFVATRPARAQDKAQP